MKNIPLERVAEGYLDTETRKRDGLCLKFVSPGTAGVFDRLLLLPGGVSVFVEVKRFGEPLSPLQWRFARQCERLGHETAVVDSRPAVDSLFEFLDARPSVSGRLVCETRGPE